MKHELKRAQFDLLTRMAMPHDDPGVAPMDTETVFDPPLLKQTTAELEAAGWIAQDGVTAEGYAALEPYRARRVILVAAGFGSRLLPLTRTTPKPLVRVGGVRLIDTLIDAAQAVGIEEIVVVRGHLGEQFEALTGRYPNVRLVDNPYYKEANNISSVYMVADLLQNAYICDADLWVRRPTVFKKYHWCSNFLGIPMAHSDDWCFAMKDHVITAHQIGGDNCYQQIGVAYLDAPTGRRAGQDIKTIFAKPEGRNYFWDNALFTFYGDCYHFEIRNCVVHQDVIEIDTFAELCALDPTYLL